MRNVIFAFRNLAIATYRLMRFRVLQRLGLIHESTFRDPV